MNFNQPAYPFSAPLIVEIHKLLNELPAKQTRGLLNAIDAEMAAHQKKCDEIVPISVPQAVPANESPEPTKE